MAGALTPRVRQLFTDGRTVETTIRVAGYTESSEAEARAWAHSHGVDRIGRGFAWTESDVLRFARARLAQLEGTEFNA